MEKQALLGVLPPVIITLILVVIAWRPWKKSGWPNGDWGSALGVAAGYATADILVRGWQGALPSGGDLHPHIAVLAAFFVMATSRPKLATFRSLLAIILTVGAAALVLRTSLADNRDVALKVLGISAGAGLVMWASCSTAAKCSGGARVPLMLWAAAAGNALIFLQNTSLSLAQMSGALAACMGVFVLLGWWRPLLPAVRGAIPVYVLVMLGLLIAGRGFAVEWRTTQWSFILAACAVASPLLTLFPPIKKLKPWQGTLVGMLLTVALCIAGLALSPNKFDFSGYN